jgi:hypothetical protein
MEIIRAILNYEYDSYNNLFTIEFTTDSDQDEFFRLQELDKDTFLYYYPEVFDIKKWRDELEERSIILMLEDFYEDDNEFPTQQLL